MQDTLIRHIDNPNSPLEPERTAQLGRSPARPRLPLMERIVIWRPVRWDHIGRALQDFPF